jgi:hypothetical protein
VGAQIGDAKQECSLTTTVRELTTSRVFISDENKMKRDLIIDLLPKLYTIPGDCPTCMIEDGCSAAQ